MMKNRSSQNYFSMRGRGLPRWWALPLEMLSTCTCYSPRVHAIAGCIRDGSGTCHLLIAQRGHLWFLHVSDFYWTMCRFPVVPHVSFLLAHVSCCHWITCHFFIGPHVVFLLFHRSVFYQHMCHVAVGSHVTSSLDHVLFFIGPRLRFLFDHA